MPRMIDVEGALFGLVLTPMTGGGVVAETFGRMPKPFAAAYLRRVADALDAEGADEGYAPAPSPAPRIENTHD